MRLQICICCGETIAGTRDAFSCNVNVCASCFSASDELPEPGASSVPDFDDKHEVWKDFLRVKEETVPEFAPN